MAYVRVGSAVNEPLGSLFRTKVVNGLLMPTAVRMSAKQQAAIGAFVDDYGKPFCTGTLISKHIVLSAAHCGVQVGDRFALGADLKQPSASAYVTALVRHPLWQGVEHDHLLALLDRDLDVDPPALSEEVPPVEATIQGVGYGMVDPEISDNTKRWWVAEPVSSVSPGWFSVSGQGQRGLCLGDSGGPAFVEVEGKPSLVGTVSQGAVSCVGEDTYSRPDLAWVEPIVVGWKTPGRKPLKAWVPTAVTIVFVGLGVGLLVGALRR